jgi:hypothetical protein
MSYLKTKIVTSILLSYILVGTVLGVAFATPNTKVDLVQDQGPGGTGTLDMDGPTGYGFVNFNQDENGTLRVTVAIKNAEPYANYTVYLTCGPTHAAACGFIVIGNITTNGQGNGNSDSIYVDLATLQAAPFGSGERTDHIDIGGTSGDWLVAGGIDYSVP